MSQLPAPRTSNLRSGVGLALVSAVTAGTVLPITAAPAEAAPVAAAAPRPVAQRVASPIPAAPSAATYTVRPGDTVWSIAQRTGTSASAIIAANNLGSAAVIYPGQTLNLSGSAEVSGSSRASSSGARASGTSYTVQRGDTVSGIARKTGTSTSAIIAANGLGKDAVIYPGQTLTLSGSARVSSSASSNKATSSTGSRSYTVQRGDTVTGIAAKTGTSVAAIISANNLGSAAVIYPGQTLKLSGSAKASSSSAGRVGSTFAGRSYTSDVVGAANRNAAALDSRAVPSRNEMRSMVRQVANQMGVDPSLALAHAHLESGFNQRAVSPANAVGVMQVIPSSGEWASQLVGRNLDLLDPHDNVVAGVAIIRQLHRMEPNSDKAIAGYYQGLGSVRKNGMYSDTQRYVNNIKSLRSQY